MIEKTKKELLPILFSTVIVSAVMYVFNPKTIFFIAVLAFLINALCFNFCGYLQRQGKRAAGVYIVVLIIIGLFSYFIIKISSPDGLSDFINYFFGGLSDNTSAFLYSVVLFTIFNFIISSFVFYFTNIIYRSSIVFLIMLIPCGIFVKRFIEIPLIFLVLMIALYVSVMIHCKQNMLAKTINVVMDGSYKKSLSIFIISTIIIAVLIPKPQITPFKNVLDGLFANSRIVVNVPGQLGKYSMYSRGHDYNGELTNNILFTVEAEEPLYLRKQVFDIYDKNRWQSYQDNNFNYGTSNWGKSVFCNNYFSLKQAIKEVCEIDNSFAKKYSLTSSMFDNIKLDEKTAKIIGSNFSNSLFLNLINTYGIDSTYEKTYKNESGEIFLGGTGKIYEEDIYTIKYYSESYYNSSTFDFAKKFNHEKYSDFFKDINTILTSNEKSSTETKFLQYWLQNLNVSIYYSNTYSLSSPKIQSLAREITEDCDSDIEKATAIKNYFSLNGFKYDLKYIPPKGSEDIEYFIFSSKKGSCSDYATAMTLMAREVGLPARYVEGFMVDEKDKAGLYVVRELDAHAFVEVYISGIGWMTFDATVSSDEIAKGNNKNSNSNIITKAVNNKLIIIVIIASLFVGILIAIFTSKIKECAFRFYLKFKNKNQRVVLLFKNARKLVGKKLNIKIDALSSKKVRDLVFENYNVDILELAEAFDEICYGEKTISNETFKISYKCYLSFYVTANSKTKKK